MIDVLAIALDTTSPDTAPLVDNVDKGWRRPAFESEVFRCLVFGAPPASGTGAGSVPEWLRVGTSPSIDDQRTFLRERVSSLRGFARLSEPARNANVLALSLPEQLREVSAALSLNKSLLAQIMGVSRPTLYEWLEGNPPSAANTSRLTRLVQLLSGSGVSGSAPLNARFVRQPLGLGRPSLVELLSQEPLDPQAALNAIADARRLGEEASQSTAVREERLRQRGFEDVSEQQRREQLATTLALLPSPK